MHQINNDKIVSANFLGDCPSPPSYIIKCLQNVCLARGSFLVRSVPVGFFREVTGTLVGQICLDHLLFFYRIKFCYIWFYIYYWSFVQHINTLNFNLAAINFFEFNNTNTNRIWSSWRPC